MPDDTDDIAPRDDGTDAAPRDDGTDAGRPSEGTAHPDDQPRPREEGLDEESRRWLIRALVGLAIGIPVAIEASTFVGLLNKHFGGGGTDTATSDETPTGRRVGVGDELLPETPQSDVLHYAAVHDEGDAWVFEATVLVENTGDVPYEARVGAATAGDGTRVEGSDATGQVPPGESATVTATRRLPAGAEPERLVVSGVTYGETTTSVRENVRLASVPIRS